MSQPINADGYQSIRDWLQSSSGWNWVALINDQGSEITRLDIANDSRATWVHQSGAQVLQVELDISGSDADIDETGTDIEKTASYDTSSGGNNLADDTFPVYSITSTSDSVVITHEIEVPQL